MFVWSHLFDRYKIYHVVYLELFLVPSNKQQQQQQQKNPTQSTDFISSFSAAMLITKINKSVQ